MRVCRKLKQLVIDHPPADREALLTLAQQAKSDLKFEDSLQITAGDIKPGPQPVVVAAEQTEDIPF